MTSSIHLHLTISKRHCSSSPSLNPPHIILRQDGIISLLPHARHGQPTPQQHHPHHRRSRVNPTQLHQTSLKPTLTSSLSGIGLATSLYLHTPTYQNKIICLDLPPTPPASIPSSLTSSPRYLYIPCNLTSWPAQRDAFLLAANKFSGLDHVFINAGLAEIGDQIWTDTYSQKDAQLDEPNRATIDVDIRAVGDSLKLAMFHLRRDGKGGSGLGRGGSIVMTASLAGYLASAGAPLYSAAKHGVVGYMRALKGDCAKAGIGISVIAPGITLTNIVLGRKENQSLEDWGKEMAGKGVPINDAQTVALVVANLMGEGAKCNGKGILIQANRCQEIEGGIAKSREQWMGKEMLDLFRGGRNAPLFPNKL